MFTCGDGQKTSVVSALYHASSGASEDSTGSQRQPAAHSESSPAENEESNGSSSTAAGPIAGGVVGGLVVIVIPIVVWLILRQKRQRKDADMSNAASASMTELQKPQTSHSQNMSEPDSDGKGQPQYAEMEIPPSELALGKVHYSHELSYAPAAPTALGRSELSGNDHPGTQETFRSELDGNAPRH